MLPDTVQSYVALATGMATAATQLPSEAAGASQPSSQPANGGTGLASEGRKISTADIQLVQNLIERCLQLYMSQREVVFTLNQQAKIEPGFTLLVWQKLEEQNPDFFRAYYTRQAACIMLSNRVIRAPALFELDVHKTASPDTLQASRLKPNGSSCWLRLKLKDQIVLFNHLLEQQVQMLHKVQQGWLQPPGETVCVYLSLACSVESEQLLLALCT